MLAEPIPDYVVLIDHLKQVHIEGELETIESALWYNRLIRNDYNVAMSTGGSALDDPDVMFYEAYACGSERNYTGDCDKEMQARFDQQSATVDPVRRKELVQQIDHDLQMQDVRPSIFHMRANTCWQSRCMASRLPPTRSTTTGTSKRSGSTSNHGRYVENTANFSGALRTTADHPRDGLLTGGLGTRCLS